MTRSVQRTIAGVALASAAVALAQAPKHIEPGPYKAGYVQVVETRVAPPAGNARPIVMSIFYPVDPSLVTDTTPRPDYWVHPGHPVIGNRVFPSSAYDQFAFEPSYSNLPVASGKPFPMVVHSPGAGTPWLTGTILGANLATYGYIVVQIGHLDVGLQEASAVKLRDGDVRFVLDRILERHSTTGDLLEGAIDTEKIAGAGWSFGGYTVAALAGGDDEPCVWLNPPNPPAWACEPVAPDPRLKALVLLDPSTWASDPWDLNRIAVPVISIHQSYDSLRSFNVPGGTNAYHHAMITGTPNYRVDVDRSNHFRFGSWCEYQRLNCLYGYITPQQCAASLAARLCDSPDRLHTWQVMYPLIAEYAIAFLETHLARRPGMQHLLTPGHAQTRETFIHFLTSEPISPYIPLEHVHEFWYFPYQPGSATEHADVAELRLGRPFVIEEEE